MRQRLFILVLLLFVPVVGFGQAGNNIITGNSEGSDASIPEAAPLVASQTSDNRSGNQTGRCCLPLPNRAASSLAAWAPSGVIIDAGTGMAENYPVNIPGATYGAADFGVVTSARPGERYSWQRN